MQLKPSFKLALVTGASSGIGKALVDFLASKNIEVIGTSRTNSTFPLDLSDRDQRKQLLDLITEKKPDLIINNAGFGFYGPTLSLSIDEQLKMVEVNVNALMEISIHSARTLIEAGKQGTILNISSAGAFFPFPNFNVYCASKAFVNQFSLTLDVELADQGVRVLCACPGQVATNFRSRAAKGHHQKTDAVTMSVETAVHHLWKQLTKQRQLYIFDWKMRLMVLFSKCIPQKRLQKMLKEKLSDRFKKNSP